MRMLVPEGMANGSSQAENNLRGPLPISALFAPLRFPCLFHRGEETAEREKRFSSRLPLLKCKHIKGLYAIWSYKARRALRKAQGSSNNLMDYLTMHIRESHVAAAETERRAFVIDT